VLNFIRKNKTAQTWVMWIIIFLLASYVLYSFGSAPAKAQGDTIAKFGKAEIKVRDALIQSTNMRRNFSAQLDDEIFNNFAANQLVNTALLRDGAAQLGLKVSDAELRDLVIDIRTQEDNTFITEEVWADYVRRSFQISVESYETFLRENALLTDHFGQLFTTSTFISEDAIRERFVADNKKVKLEMLRVSTGNIADQVQLDTDDQIKAFWEKHREEMVSGDRRKVDYVAISYRDFEDAIEIDEEEARADYEARKDSYVIPEAVTIQEILVRTDERTEDEAYQLITRVSQEVGDGMEFLVAQNEYHEGGAKGNQAIRRGMRSPEVDEALFAMNVDEISPPLKTRQGFAIYKKVAYTEESVRTFDQVRNAIISGLKRSKARDLAQAEMDKFNEKLGEGVDFTAAAEELGLKVETSPFFDDSGLSNMGPVLGRLSRIRNAVFGLAAEGDVTGILETGVYHVICKWTESAEPAPLDWETDTDRIKTLARQMGQEKKVVEILTEIREAALASPDLSLEEAAGERDWLKKDFFTTTPDPVGAESFGFTLRRQGLDFEEDVYALEAGQFIEGFETDVATNFVLARVIEKTEPDMSKLEEERFEIVQALRRENSGSLLETYLFEKRDTYDANGRKRGELIAALSNRQ